MTKQELLYRYNRKIGNVVPGVNMQTNLDILSISDVIDNSREMSFKFSLFPSEMFDSLLDFTDSTFSDELASLEALIVDRMRQIAFYPKFNITFEKRMHVPIINLNQLAASEEIESVFQIPVIVKYYLLFGDTVTTVKRYYNSNLYFDHTAYMLYPDCIVNEYNFSDLFVQTADSTVKYSDSDIWNYGIDFTEMNNFRFIIDDADIRAQTKNIVFMEIQLESHTKDFDFYVILKQGEDVYLRKGKTTGLSYRKVFYNADFINIKNRIVKYSE